MNTSTRRPLVALLSGALLLSTTQGCVTSAAFDHSERRPGMTGGSFLHVTFHPRAWQKAVCPEVQWRLYQLVQKERVLVHDGDEGSWLSPPLEPGKYEIEIRSFKHVSGEQVLRERPLTRRVTLKPDELVTAKVTMEDFRPAFWTGFGLALAGGIVWAVSELVRPLGDMHLNLSGAR